MSSVHRKKPEKPSVPKQKHPISHPQITFKINRKFTIIPTEKRRQYVEKLDKMIKRVERIINARKTKTKQRLRAMTVLSDLIKNSYGMIRDAEIEQLEREIEELEKEKGQASEAENSSK